MRATLTAVVLRKLSDIENAIRAAWSIDTCDPADVTDWGPDNPARGQCGVTSLVLHDLLGGDLLLAEVRYPSGERQGYHYWNRLTGGFELDLTREQFGETELIGSPELVVLPPGPPRRAREQYLLLRERVFAALTGEADRW